MKTIPLTQGQEAIVDNEDYDIQNQFKWCAHWVPSTKSYVAMRREVVDGVSKTIYMHREIMNTPDGMECDHRHHNTLDNRRSELRNCTQSQNRMNKRIYKNNTSGWKGVSWWEDRNKWHMQIQKDEKKIHEFYDDDVDAAKAYDAKAKQLFGEFANLNFPDE